MVLCILIEIQQDLCHGGTRTAPCCCSLIYSYILMVFLIYSPVHSLDGNLVLTLLTLEGSMELMSAVCYECSSGRHSLDMYA